MKIAVGSDLHLEFAPLDLKNTEGAEVLILAGDILVVEDLRRWPVGHEPNGSGPSYRQTNAHRYREFLDMVSKEFPHVLYVAGNHEYYDGKWNQSEEVLREEVKTYGNIHFLENETFELNGVTFIGTTLWTDMNKSDPLTLHATRDMMSDFKVITNDERGYTKLRPVHTLERHRKALDYIKAVTAEKHDDIFVVISHHAPCRLSLDPAFVNQYLMNGAFASDLSDFIIDRPQIKVWCHGHVHNENDYMVGDTRIVCNPRGYYGYERLSVGYELKYLEV